MPDLHKGSDDETAALARSVADRLRNRAAALADEWVEVLQDRLEIPPARSLPSDSVRDHVPEMISEASRHLIDPNPTVSPGTVESLRAFAELRREQGYDESEVLAELGALHLAIFAELGEALRGFSDDPGSDVVASVATRLHRVLDRMSAVVTAVLRERERQESGELSRRLSEFVRTIMHELKDPLNAAMQSVTMLETEGLGLEREGELRRIAVRSLQKLDDLLSDLAMVEDVEATRAEGRWIRLPDAVDDVLERCAEDAQAEKVTVEVDEVPDVKVDASAVEIPLRNLVRNAVKYSDPKEEHRWVRISFSRRGEGEVGVPRWRITVADNGIGIPRDTQDRIFERGFRDAPSTVGGSGLGLSIARQMARQRGGRISFESRPGAGSTFHLDVREQRSEGEEGR